MVTAAASARPLVPSAARDRRFYIAMAVAMLFTAVFGFARTYVLGLLFGYPSTITGRHLFGIVHLHALVFTGWLVLLIVQTSLIAAHRVKVHRTLGYFGAAWGVLMIVVGIALAVNAARAGAAPPGADPYAFLAIPFGDLAIFTIFFAAAVAWRNYKERHKRLMVLASAALMTAALARWPGVLGLGPLVYYGLTLLFPVAGAVYDRVSRGRVHPAYWWGMAIMVAGVAVRIVLIGSPAWQHAMRSLLG